MDGDGFDIIRKLIVRNHHQCSTLLKQRFHHGNMANAVVIEIPLPAFAIDSSG